MNIIQKLAMRVILSSDELINETVHKWANGREIKNVEVTNSSNFTLENAIVFNATFTNCDNLEIRKGNEINNMVVTIGSRK